MSAGLAADAVVVLHFAFVLFVIFGGAAVVWRTKAAWLHLPALAWGIWIEISHGICPLTPLENRLREAAAQAAYPESFIEHHLIPILYPAGLTPALQLQLAALLVAINLLLYGWAWLRWRRKKRSHAAPTR